MKQEKAIQPISNQEFAELLNFIISKGFAKTMRNIAEKTEYDYTYLSQIKNGHRDVSQNVLQDFSKHYDIREFFETLGQTKTATKMDAVEKKKLEDEIAELKVRFAILERLVLSKGY